MCCTNELDLALVGNIGRSSVLLNVYLMSVVSHRHWSTIGQEVTSSDVLARLEESVSLTGIIRLADEGRVLMEDVVPVWLD